jgi:hypothetical protein
MTVMELMEFIGPLRCAQHEQIRACLAQEYEYLGENLELAARLGDQYREWVEEIRQTWAVASIARLFQWLWAQMKDELAA